MPGVSSVPNGLSAKRLRLAWSALEAARNGNGGRVASLREEWVTIFVTSAQSISSFFSLYLSARKLMPRSFAAAVLL